MAQYLSSALVVNFLTVRSTTDAPQTTMTGQQRLKMAMKDLMVTSWYGIPCLNVPSNFHQWVFVLTKKPSCDNLKSQDKSNVSRFTSTNVCSTTNFPSLLVVVSVKAACVWYYSTRRTSAKFKPASGPTRCAKSATHSACHSFSF